MQGHTAPILEEIQERLSVRVGPARYKVWFKNATHMTWTDRLLELSVPNQFICGYIERHFADIISDVAKAVGGADAQVSFKVDTRISGRVRKSQLNSQAEHIARQPAQVRPSVQMRTMRNQPSLRGRLENFVIAPCNQLAFNAAMEIIDQSPAAPSPLFIHGSCGFGKTHLMQAIANRINERGTNGRNQTCAYLSGEEFTNQFLTAMRAGNLEAFRRHYREVDVLLLDDVHFLANKKATQEEFLHTFNALDMVGKRVALASDAHPRMIGQMSEALINRFMSGMVVRVDAPDHATRCRILRQKLAETGQRGSDTRHVPDAVIEYIADRIRSSVRELEGGLTRVLAYSAMADSAPTLALARQVLEDHASANEPAMSAEHIEHVVATFFGLSPADLHTTRKTKTITLARSLAMFLARKHTPLSYPELGRLMGNKNHTTVLHAERRVRKQLESESQVSWATSAGNKSELLSALLARLERQFIESAAAS